MSKADFGRAHSLDLFRGSAISVDRPGAMYLDRISQDVSVRSINTK